jgi:hypothetical protein
MALSSHFLTKTIFMILDCPLIDYHPIHIFFVFESQLPPNEGSWYIEPNSTSLVVFWF